MISWFEHAKVILRDNFDDVVISSCFDEVIVKFMMK